MRRLRCRNASKLDRRVLGLLHTIRKLGNIAAHGKRPVSADEARDA
ncbi:MULTISPECIES: DUF4145 domain-containing protein [unclassified Sulfitobacter]